MMGIPYAAQLAELDTSVRAMLAGLVPESAWEPVVAGPDSGFRNKAKLAVGGRRGEPTLGILDATGDGVDLRRCGLYEPGLAAALPPLAEFVGEVEFTPYDVARRNGELKGLIVTHSPDGELMIRFVLRSPGQLAKLRRALSRLAERLPATRVVSVNLLPRHVALVEGDQEITLAGSTLPMRLRPPRDPRLPDPSEVTLHLRPRSFFQTNTQVAAALYQAARRWVSEAEPATVWDLYCGVGGFALHLAGPGRQVTGVELSGEAVASAQTAAAERPGAGDRLDFLTGDATTYAVQHPAPELVVVNPPRRGIGSVLADRLHDRGPRWVLYSSCNAATLAADLARMPSMRVCRAQAFAMFPQTRHHEVLVLARR